VACAQPSNLSARPVPCVSPEKRTALDEMAPPSFKDLGKSLNELFDKGFSYRQTAQVKTDVAGVGVTTNLELKDFNAVTGNVEAKFSEGDLSGTVSANNDLLVKATVKMANVADGVNVNVGVDTDTNGNAGFDYKNDSLSVDVGACLKDATHVTASVAAAVSDSVNVGGIVRYDATTDKLERYDAKMTLKNADMGFSLGTGAKFSSFNFGVLYPVQDNVTVGTIATYDTKGESFSFAVAGQYSCHPSVDMKAKFNSSDATAAASLQHKLNDNFTYGLCASASVPAFSGVKYGVGLKCSF